MITYHNDLAKRSLTEAVAKAREFPRASKNRQSFLRSIRTLNRFKKQTGLKIFWDFCESSFCWEACGMYGGMIFHNYCQEWSIHT